MKRALTILLIAVLFVATSLALLRAQTNEGDTNIVTAATQSTVISLSPLSITSSNPAAGIKHKSLSNPQPARVGPASPFADFNPGKGNYYPLGFDKTLVALAGIAIPAIVIFGLPVAIVITVFHYRHRQNKLVHETVRAMVERGIPVTPETIEGLNPRGFKVNVQGKWEYPRFRNRHLLPGLVLTGAGLALMIGLPEHSGPAGLIILFVGLAFLIVWLVERKQNANDQRKQENDQQPRKT